MPLPSRATARISARSVYSRRKSAEKQPVEKVQDVPKRSRGRPKKYPLSPTKILPKKVQRRGKASLKVGKKTQSDSSDADRSSEGEDDEDGSQQEDIDNQVNEEAIRKEEEAEKEEEESGDDAENEEEESEEEESEEEVENGEKEKSDDEEGLEGQSDQEDSDENARYSISKRSPVKKESLNRKDRVSKASSDSVKKNLFKTPQNKLSPGKQNKVIKANDRVSKASSDSVEKNISKTPQNKLSPVKQNKVIKTNGEDKPLLFFNSMLTFENGVVQRPMSAKRKQSHFAQPVTKKIKSESERKSISSNNSANFKRNLNNIYDETFHSDRFLTLHNIPDVDCLNSLVAYNKHSSCGNIAADKTFHALINPMTPTEFFDDYFEKEPFHVRRENPEYYMEVFSCKDLETVLRENNLQYEVHIDVLKYADGKRYPINSIGRAYASNVWDDFKNGYSVRLRNPQAYNKIIWNMCALLQEYFSSSVGVNAYLTPPNAQGFPPHYDDIDAFIIQIEGTKDWKVYSPRNDSEDLARYSSIDFNQNEIGEPLMEITLHAGDSLYIPRGYIHQAVTTSTHSLHLTFSTNQLNTWGDLLLPAISKAVEKAILNDVEFRKAIPKDFMTYTGSAVPDSSLNTYLSRQFEHKLKILAVKSIDYIDFNEAADTHAVRFLQSSLLPTFNKAEKQRSVHGNGSTWRNGGVRIKKIFTLDCKIQLIRKRILRLIVEESTAKIYHTLENNRDPKGLEDENQVVSYVVFDPDGLPAYTMLMEKYPDFVKIGDLPIEESADKIMFAEALYENGLLMTEHPLTPLENGHNEIVALGYSKEMEK